MLKYFQDIVTKNSSYSKSIYLENQENINYHIYYLVLFEIFEKTRNCPLFAFKLSFSCLSPILEHKAFPSWITYNICPFYEFSHSQWHQIPSRRTQVFVSK